MTRRQALADLASGNRAKLFATAGNAFDVAVALAPEHLYYLSGYKSMAHDTDRHHQMAVLATPELCLLVAPASDLGAALEILPRGSIFTYGEFYFEENGALASGAAYPSFLDALAAALRSCPPAGTVGIDEQPEGPVAAHVARAFPNRRVVAARPHFIRSRATKSEREIELLRVVSSVAEAALGGALAVARSGMSEWELAAVISSEMVSRGAVPGFVVVTSGERSALADAYPTSRKLTGGDLVRIDVGCAVDGYWADTARTAFVGGPDSRVRQSFDAIRQGEAWALENIKAGMTAGELFLKTVEQVRGAGLPGYARHHIGHGLGLECYEYPKLGPREAAQLEAGMVLCVETPLYVLGWGGMMVEDTIVLRDHGCERLTHLDTDLLVIPA